MTTTTALQRYKEYVTGLCNEDPSLTPMQLDNTAETDVSVDSMP